MVKEDVKYPVLMLDKFLRFHVCNTKQRLHHDINIAGYRRDCKSKNEGDRIHLISKIIWEKLSSKENPVNGNR